MDTEGRRRLEHERAQQICEANGYGHYVAFPNGRDACLAGYLYTVAILADIGTHGFGDRWCYETFDKALAALREWTARGGEGEPEGWHRNPPSGRRREGGDASKEYIAP